MSDQPTTNEFTGRDLAGARFTACDLSGVVMRGVEISGEIDAPWLIESDATLLVNGVDVVPLVDAELNRRFPGRALRRAETPEALRAAWSQIEAAWALLLDRVSTLPSDVVDESVAGEWSLAQTLRHLVLATDMWLGKAVLDRPVPFHPMGQLDRGTAGDGFDSSAFVGQSPTFDEVLEIRAGRQAMVRDFLARVDDELLAQRRPNPHAPQHDETVLSCLHTILEEEWEHLRYASRDLGVLEATAQK